MGYQRLLYRVSKGNTRRNRLGACTYMKRRAEKLCGPSTWFRRRRDQEEEESDPVRNRKRIQSKHYKRPIETVMFVLQTAGSVLKKILQCQWVKAKSDT